MDELAKARCCGHTTAITELQEELLQGIWVHKGLYIISPCPFERDNNIEEKHLDTGDVLDN